jgi:hypothetical protein
MINECGVVGAIRIGRRNCSASRKPVTVPFCPPQIPHVQTWDRTRTAAARSRQEFLTLALDGGEWSTSRLLLVWRPGGHESQSGRCVTKNLLLLPAIEPRYFGRPALSAGRYTDRTIQYVVCSVLRERCATTSLGCSGDTDSVIMMIIITPWL